jgi:hypothetical protein
MNEMRQLEDMCAAVPPPDQETLARTRARVLISAGARGGESRVGHGGLTRRLLARRTVITRPRVALTGGGAAVAAAALAVAMFSGAAPTPGTRARLEAAVVLNRAAEAALAAPAPRPGQFVYVDIRAVSPHRKNRAYRHTDPRELGRADLRLGHDPADRFRLAAQVPGKTQCVCL